MGDLNKTNTNKKRANGSNLKIGNDLGEKRGRVRLGGSPALQKDRERTSARAEMTDDEQKEMLTSRPVNNICGRNGVRKQRNKS